MAEVNNSKIQQCREYFSPNERASDESKAGFKAAIGDYQKLPKKELEMKLLFHQQRVSSGSKATDAEKSESAGYLGGLGSVGITGIVGSGQVDTNTQEGVQFKQCLDYLRSGAMKLYQEDKPGATKLIAKASAKHQVNGAVRLLGNNNRWEIKKSEGSNITSIKIPEVKCTVK